MAQLGQGGAENLTRTRHLSAFALFGVCDFGRLFMAELRNEAGCLTFDPPLPDETPPQAQATRHRRRSLATAAGCGLDARIAGEVRRRAQ
jgi:hypothetical protein